uniref:Uncharacterized protein n=1 Tax=Romanomermis culicivorax TaxID=13658 RepID=A0A915KAA4_ROMCU
MWKYPQNEQSSAHILLVLSITGFVTYLMLDAALSIDRSNLALIYFRVSGVYEFYLLLAAHLITQSISNLLMIFSVEKNDVLSLHF